MSLLLAAETSPQTFTYAGQVNAASAVAAGYCRTKAPGALIAGVSGVSAALARTIAPEAVIPGFAGVDGVTVFVPAVSPPPLGGSAWVPITRAAPRRVFVADARVRVRVGVEAQVSRTVAPLTRIHAHRARPASKTAHVDLAWLRADDDELLEMLLLWRQHGH